MRSSLFMALIMAMSAYGSTYALAQNQQSQQKSSQTEDQLEISQQSDLYVDSVTGEVVHISQDGQVTPANQEELQILDQATPDMTIQGRWHGGHGWRHGGWRGGRWGHGRYYDPYYPCNPRFYPYDCY